MVNLHHKTVTQRGVTESIEGFAVWFVVDGEGLYDKAEEAVLRGRPFSPVSVVLTKNMAEVLPVEFSPEA